MAVVKNMLVRVGGDFSGLFGEAKKANKQMRKEFDDMGKAASGSNLGSMFKSFSDDAKGELAQTEAQIAKLTEYSGRLEAQLKDTLGGSYAESGLGKELDAVTAKIAELSGRSAVLQVQSDWADEISQPLSAIAQFKANLAEFGAEVGQMFGAVSARAKNAGIGILSALKPINLLKAGMSGAASVGRRMWSVIRPDRSLPALFKPITSGISSMWNGMKRMASMYLGFGLVTSVLGRLKSVVSDYIGQNATLKAQTEALKNAMGQALAPAINIVINAMSLLMPYIVGVSNAIGQLITNIFGNGWTTVANGANAAAAATGSAAAAQEEYNRQLAGFDEITKLSDNKSKSGGGGGGGASGSSSQQIQGQMPSWLTSIADSIKQSIEKDDWSIVGAELVKQLRGDFDKADAWLKSYDFGDLGKSIAQGLNGAIREANTGDGTSIGTLLADIFNAGIEAITSGAIELDWGGLGELIVAEVGDFLAGLDWANLATGVGAIAGGIVTAIGQPLVDGIRQIDEFFSAEIEEAGGAVWDGICNGVVKAVSAAGTWFVDNIFEPFLEGFKAAFDIHSPAANPELLEAAGNVGLGILNGIAEPFLAVTNWVKDKIITPLQNAINKSDKPKITPAITKNTTEMWNKVKTWWGTKTLKAGTALSTTKDNIKKWWTNVKNWWNKAKGGEKLSSVKAGIENTAYKWWQDVSGWWNSAKKTLSSVTVNAVKGLGWGNMSSWLGGLQKYINLSVAWNNPNGWIEEAISKYIFDSKGIPKISFAARGGVVDQATLFGNTVVGEAGAEMIMPLENNTGYLRILAEQIAGALYDRQGNAQNIYITLQMDGKTIGKAAVKYINGQAALTGVNPIAAHM